MVSLYDLDALIVVGTICTLPDICLKLEGIIYYEVTKCNIVLFNCYLSI